MRMERNGVRKKEKWSENGTRTNESLRRRRKEMEGSMERWS